MKNKKRKFNVSEVDETTYLLQSEANKKRLLQSIVNIETQQNLVDVPQSMTNTV